MYASMPDTYHLRYAYSTNRWVTDTETVIIPRKISIIPPQVPPTGRGKTPEASLLWEDPEERLEK
ncbi:hypothetical protein E2C01_041303 [Portunus trituberculatus]|uniref:Uncharacterized protein n=1 Tax=Portunus trituberculatus TaxID=210409 RepID=A0A5B7FT77_PORTR|nr:hypothetical protein [Portunus trituberculatus]